MSAPRITTKIELQRLADHLNGMRYKRKNKSDGEIYDFAEQLLYGPVEKKEYRFNNPELIKRVRVFFVNNNFPFTVLDNGKEWYLDLRKERNGAMSGDNKRHD